MDTIESVEAWRKTLSAERAGGRVVGLVPTMGFLHEGHASLIRRAAAECDVVGVTIFVNPLQFGPTEDLTAYPRDLPADCRLAEQCGASYIFAPSVREMYPSPMATAVTVAGLGDRFEGATRPGHFDGVATVVAKLFAQAGPCRAYFGEKDFQQLAVIRRMTSDLCLPVQIIGAPTVREADGLALSSRNVYLTPAERSVAPTLSRALRAAAQLMAPAPQPATSDRRRAGPKVDRVAGDPTAAGLTPGDVRRAMTEIVAAEPLIALDYADVIDATTFTTATSLQGELRLIIAARIGRARLIDNLGVNR